MFSTAAIHALGNLNGHPHFRKAAIFAVLFAFNLQSCGMTGNIRIYEFRVSKRVIERQIEWVLSQRTEFNLPARHPYELDEDWKFIVIGSDVCGVAFYGDSTYWSEHPSDTRLALVTFGKILKPLKAEAHLSNDEKRQATDEFEHVFLRTLGLPYTISQDSYY